ncbi:MAG: Patatin-like phospholipase [Syntrophaceae bacterium PtaU1.Bin231]|jgi:NTE family protein|nr:MAG: Patatin-like phospholipase [Syntrophaceae bacterium PtaU1.Bin231]
MKRSPARSGWSGAMVGGWSAGFLVSLAFLMLSACTAQFPVNPKTAIVLQPGQADPLLRKIAHTDRSDTLLFFMTFSGGGSRAAALSYGVLEALERVKVPHPKNKPETASRAARHTLLDEVDIISSVSGGSFTSAYYGLHGKKIFTDYKEHFLLRDFQGALLLKLVNPINWFAIGSPYFGRSDLAAEYYEENLFQGATLGQMVKTGGPAILIQATDVTDGFIFSFTPGMFSLLCSDYDRFPVSRAVAASAALPGAFSPIALKNYTGQCHSKGLPGWMRQSLDKPDMSSRIYYNAVRLNTYLDTKTKPFVYLVDGGVADNLGVRGPLESMIARGNPRDLMKDSGFENTKQVVFLIVDAQTQEMSRWRFLNEIPGLAMILDATSTIMVNKYNFETIELLNRYAKEWTYNDKVKGLVPIDFHIIHVTFDVLPKEEKEYFQQIPTTLRLTEEQVDKLREVAGRILYSDETFRKFVRSLGGTIPPNLTIVKAEKPAPEPAAPPVKTVPVTVSEP